MKNINCVFDGACEPNNPGGALGIGGAIFEDKTLLYKYSHFELPSPYNTNNVAEYKGILWVLNTLVENKLTNEKIHIFGDSKLVICQMNLQWKIKNGVYVPFAKKALEKIKQFKNISFEWIPREKNGFADSLSKNELILNRIEITKREKLK